MGDATPRWCPSCRHEWPAGTVACRRCFVELVEVGELSAVARCRHCLKDWPSRMKSCPECLAELRVDPGRAREMLSVVLARGFYLARPEATVPFEQGPACTLLRARPQASMIFVGADGFLEAHVDGHDHRAIPPLTCRDLDGQEIFRLDRYQAAADALVAFGADGAPLGTFLRRPDVIPSIIDVRDETSAPVAALRATRNWFDLVETGGSAVARFHQSQVEHDGWVDDEWSLQPLADCRVPLRPLAAVALLLAAKVLLGRAAPTQLPKQQQLNWQDLADGL